MVQKTMARSSLNIGVVVDIRMPCADAEPLPWPSVNPESLAVLSDSVAHPVPTMLLIASVDGWVRLQVHCEIA